MVVLEEFSLTCGFPPLSLNTSFLIRGESASRGKRPKSIHFALFREDQEEKRFAWREQSRASFHPGFAEILVTREATGMRLKGHAGTPLPRHGAKIRSSCTVREIRNSNETSKESILSSLSSSLSKLLPSWEEFERNRWRIVVFSLQANWKREEGRGALVRERSIYDISSNAFD